MPTMSGPADLIPDKIVITVTWMDGEVQVYRYYLVSRDPQHRLENGVLTIEGEKRLEHEEEKENYHVMERRYGGSNARFAFRIRSTKARSKPVSIRAY